MKTRSTLAGLIVATAMCAVVPQVGAESFLLHNGETVEGAVVRSMGKTLSLKMPERGMRQLPINQVAQVEMTLRSGERIIGELIAWSSRGYEIKVADRLLNVKDGELISDVALNAEPAKGTIRNEGVGGPRISVLDPGRLQKAESTPKAEPADAATPVPILTGSSTPVDEDAGEAIIHLSLSEASPQPVAVIYSSIGRAAKSGIDYHESAGVAIIQPGTTGIDVVVKVINDDLAEPDEEFELFLSVDPKAASLEGRSIITVVRDDDS